MSEQSPSCERFEAHKLRARDGRAIAVWSLSPARPKAAIVVAPGFARRMDHFGPMALYLARNGFATYRFDSLDHVGLSDGDMCQFTMGAALDSLRCTIELACERQRTAQVGVLATSIGARVTYELAPECPGIGYLLTAVGVVNLRRTMALAFGDDYLSRSPEEAPEYVLFERKQIDALHFYRDSLSRPWLTVEGTIAALAKAPQPIVNFTAADDQWVDPEEVRRAFEEGHGGPRRMLSLLRSGHDFGRNAAAARTFLSRATEEAISLAGLPPAALQEPSFEELAELQIRERRLQRGRLQRAGTAERLAAIAAAETKDETTLSEV